MTTAKTREPEAPIPQPQHKHREAKGLTCHPHIRGDKETAEKVTERKEEGREHVRLHTLWEAIRHPSRSILVGVIFYGQTAH